MDHLVLLLSQQAPLLFACCESKLTNKILDSEISIPNYTLIREDRPPHHGLCLYIHSSLTAQRCPQFEDSNHEFISLRLILPSSSKIVFFIYRSPSANSNIFSVISDQIDKALIAHPNTEIVVAGDFNIHHNEWLTHSTFTDAPGIAAFNLSISHNLTQLINFPTRIPDRQGDKSNTLDLFLTSHPDHYNISCVSPLGSSDHVVVNCTQTTTSVTQPKHIVQHRICHYKSADWEGLNKHLSTQTWKSIITADIDNSVSKLTHTIQTAMANFIPNKKFIRKSNSAPWFNQACKTAISQRNHYFHMYKSEPTEENRKAFEQARSTSQRIIRQAKSSYAELFQDKISQCKVGDKTFWKLTNQIQKSKHKSAIPSLVEGNQVLTDGKDKANLLCSLFANISTLDDQGEEPPRFSERTEKKLPQIRIFPKCVRRALQKLDISKAAGPDGIPAIVLKQCSRSLAAPLSRLFNFSLKSGHFPNVWKEARVQPAFKKGDHSCPSNYRPISLLPIMSKVFESLVNNRIVHHLESNQLLCDAQYGFRSQRSTADLLSLASDMWSKSLDDWGESRVVSLDISKAFDRVWHKGLLHKLPSYGICGTTLQWISSYLSCREISVVVEGTSSEKQAINAGVPQGSVLGPTLFLLYINDLPDQIQADTFIFADDTMLSHSTHFKSQSESSRLLEEKRATSAAILNNDLASIAEWGKKWLVAFNPTKTQTINISLKRSQELPPLVMSDVQLENADSLHLLGMDISNKLSWTNHVACIAKRASQRLGALYRIRSYLTKESILYLYKTQIRPILEYCSHLWSRSTASGSALLDRIQRRVTNLIGPELSQKLEPLSHRRDVSSLTLFYRYHSGLCSSKLHRSVPPLKQMKRQLRSADTNHKLTLEVDRCRTAHHLNSFFPQTTKLWNSLPADIFPDSPHPTKFKTCVNRWLKSRIC